MAAIVHVCGFRDAPTDRRLVINVTSNGKQSFWRQLSPFLLGPVDLYGGRCAQNVENAWQYSKVYPKHADDEGGPSSAYFSWARAGWSKQRADRYPMGKGIKPLYSWWDGERLSYIQARTRIYAPLYSSAVAKTEAFRRLRQMRRNEEEIWLWDYDGYDHHKLGMDLQDVLLCPDRKMGHAFVLAMMLERRLPKILAHAESVLF